MLNGLLIASICAGVSGTYAPACNKATEAAGLQLGLSQNISLAENKVTTYGNETGENLLGKDLWTAGGVMGGLTLRVVRDHALDYKIHTKSYLPVDYITPGVKGIGQPNQAGGSLGLGWTW